MNDEVTTTVPPITVLMPAFMEAARIADSVRAARTIPGVTRVLVIDDGSTDDTARLAEQAGAAVLRLPVNGGKGAALRAGLAECPGADDDIFLLLDADLQESAAQGGSLLTPLLADTADLTIAVFPKLAIKTGFGLVKGLARYGTWALTRNWLEAPISGQRACRRWVLNATPLAADYGIEVAMNIAAGDADARIHEVPVQMTHQVSGRDIRGFQHRGQQFIQISHALLAAAFGRTGQRLFSSPLSRARLTVWLLALLTAGYLVFRHGALLPVLLAVVLGIPLAALASGLLRVRRANYRKRYLPALGGLILLPTLLALFGMARWHMNDARWLVGALLAWLLLGMFDDVLGTTRRKGFRGHLSSLFHGHLTSGGVKLLGGGLLALGMACYLPNGDYSRWLTVPTSALLIALSANTINLFDLRPGRALKITWLLLLPLIAYGILHVGVSLPLLSALLLCAITLFAITLLYAPLDFAGMMMLGDTGSNTLGAFIGLYLAASLPEYGQCLALLPLIALHIYAERASITQTIARTGWLRKLDEVARAKEV